MMSQSNSSFDRGTRFDCDYSRLPAVLVDWVNIGLVIDLTIHLMAALLTQARLRWTSSSLVANQQTRGALPSINYNPRNLSRDLCEGFSAKADFDF